MLRSMVAGDVPAWTAVAVAGIGAVGVLAGGLSTALLARRNERAHMEQELLLHGAPERLEALEEAIEVASGYRERVAIALRSFEDPPGRREFPEGALGDWDTDSKLVVKKHEATLRMRFGMEPVTKSWESWEWSIAQAAVFCESNEPHLGAPVPGSVLEKAKLQRDWTREALDHFIGEAGKAIAPTAQPPPPKRSSYTQKLFGRPGTGGT
jgi:hypothetical protein